MSFWVKAGYFSQALENREYWLERTWLSDPPGRAAKRQRQPSYSIGDRLVLWVKDRGCPAIYEVAAESRYDPAFVEAKSPGDSDRWGWVTDVSPLFAVNLPDAPTLDAIGVTSRRRAGLQNGRITISAAEYSRAHRLIAETSGALASGASSLAPQTGTLVPIESAASEGYEVRTRASISHAQRREARLVGAYRDHLVGMGHEVFRNLLVTRVGAARLYTDLYDKTTGHLIEAKAGAGRNDIRMAIGQLCDYARFVRPKRRAVLLDEKPPPDMIELLEDQGIDVIWREGKRFRDNAGGALT